MSAETLPLSHPRAPAGLSAKLPAVFLPDGEAGGVFFGVLTAHIPQPEHAPGALFPGLPALLQNLPFATHTPDAIRCDGRAAGIKKLIPILSLVVAALAVFAGPMISLRIARRQVTSSLEVANEQITAPMRQSRINSLGNLLAELASIGVVAVPEDKTHKATRLYRMAHLQYGLCLC